MKKLIAEIKTLESKVAGETGPRGGVILGRTDSGKPIYDTADHPEHKSFTSRDHADAASMHSKLTDKAWGKDKEMYDKHKDQTKAHDIATKAKQPGATRPWSPVKKKNQIDEIMKKNPKLDRDELGRLSGEHLDKVHENYHGNSAKS